MIGRKKILCVIQARGGSKGIPNKNIYKINNHPLISYSIAAAKGSKYIDDIIVSSDSIKICKVANEYGAKTPFLRPSFLAKDNTPSVDSLLYSVKKYEKIIKENFDYIIELPCVSPLRDSNFVDLAIQKIFKNNFDSVISYVNTGEKHPIRLKRISSNKVTNFCREYPEIEKKSFRQSFEPSYIRNGAIYCMTRKCLLINKSRMGKKSFPIIMPMDKSINIDEKFDLLTVKYLIENGHGNNRPKKVILNKAPFKSDKRILITTPLHFIDRVKKEFLKFGSCTFRDGATVHELKKMIKNVEIWVTSPSPNYLINYEILKNAKKLRYIISPSTGSNHISKADCKKLKIRILTLRDTKMVKNISASSEYTFALMLSLVRNISKASQITKSGHWRDMEDNLRGSELQNKNVGIIGFGRIGSNLSRYCKAFKMNIFAFDPYKKINLKYVNQRKSIKEILRCSDILFICVHLDKKTNKMVNETWFNNMKKNLIFINTSRGEIINEKSLLKALKNKKISGAALDVLSDEKNILNKKNPLVEYSKYNENLLITPHIAGLTFDSEYKAGMATVNHIKKIINA
jgi:D-3-phosphoglycerate dehydrogenase / 2-oxoglutarate reductase